MYNPQVAVYNGLTLTNLEMTEMKYADILNNLHTLNEQELRNLNTIVCEQLRTLSTRKQLIAGASFYVGQKVRFTDSRRGRDVVIEITKINAKTIKGREIVDGKAAPFGLTWSVSPSLCKAA